MISSPISEIFVALLTHYIINNKSTKRHQNLNWGELFYVNKVRRGGYRSTGVINRPLELLCNLLSYIPKIVAYRASYIIFKLQTRSLRSQIDEIQFTSPQTNLHIDRVTPLKIFRVLCNSMSCDSITPPRVTLY